MGVENHVPTVLAIVMGPLLSHSKINLGHSLHEGVKMPYSPNLSNCFILIKKKKNMYIIYLHLANYLHFYNLRSLFFFIKKQIESLLKLDFGVPFRPIFLNCLLCGHS